MCLVSVFVSASAVDVQSFALEPKNSVNSSTGTKHYAPKYHDHHLLRKISPYMRPVVMEGRVQVFTLKPGVQEQSIPQHLLNQMREVSLSVLADNRPPQDWMKKIRSQRSKLRNPRIMNMISKVTASSYKEVISSIVGFGNRAKLPQPFTVWAQERLRSFGLPTKHDYNIVAFKKGETAPDEHIVLIGHMDTVSATVGADDNASGAAAVLEAARVFQNLKTKRSIWFILSEDEEIGLQGAIYFINQMRAAGELQKIKHVINMDMIAYNSNNIVDLETSKEFEPFANRMAEYVALYTNLTPNKVLNPWGSDHVPFIEAGIPAVLTIEHWRTHTPCWHKVCDTLEQLNFDYAKEITRLNTAAVAEMAELL